MTHFMLSPINDTISQPMQHPLNLQSCEMQGYMPIKIQ